MDRDISNAKMTLNSHIGGLVKIAPGCLFLSVSAPIACKAGNLPPEDGLDQVGRQTCFRSIFEYFDRDGV